VSFLDRNPVFKRAVVNQYQAILLGGAAAFSVLTASPLPLLLLLGAEFMAAPVLFERLRRRIEIEKKHAAREVEGLSQEERYAELQPQARERFDRLQELCRRIESNYKGLSRESRALLAEQTQKFEAILASCLRRLWLLRKYDEMIAHFDEGATRAETKKLATALADRTLDARLREAWEKNLEIKEKLLETVERNRTSRAALQAELDSMESLLQLLMQKSVAATDAEAFSAEIDDVLAQAEADAASVQEMEQLLGSIPELVQPTMGERLRSQPLGMPQTPSGRGRTGTTEGRR
jgi:hypothetical protein